MNTGMISVSSEGPPPVSRNGVKSLNVHRLISSRFVRTCPRIAGNTTSRSCCHREAPASRAVSSCVGETVPSAAAYSIIENAVPRQMLKTMIAAIGCSTSQAVPGVPSSPLSVPSCRSSSAIHRNATTEPGRIHASSTSASTSRRSTPRRPRSSQAMAKPSTAWPSTAEPMTNWSVRPREWVKLSSSSARRTLSRPVNSGSAAASPVSW